MTNNFQLVKNENTKNKSVVWKLDIGFCLWFDF